MLTKLLKGKVVPTNDGDSVPSTGPSNPERFQYIKVFELELSNMEGSPVYALTHQITIGSEVGNIIVSDSSVSPRHATFIVQDEVVSLIDHGSVRGTFVNGKKIDPGKNIILEETDIVLVGDLEVRLRVGRTLEKVPGIPEIPSEAADEETPPPHEGIEVKEVRQAAAPKDIKRFNGSKKKKVIAFQSSVYSANAVVRLFAVLSDLLLSYAILVLFMPFDEFRNLLDSVPVMIASLIDLEWSALWAPLMKDWPFIDKILKDTYSFLSGTFHFGPLFLVFIINRVVTTLVFGVSFSELLLGMRPTGNVLWARVGGVLRVLISILTFPFLVFDIPAIMSRRTFKEVITFTNIEAPSTFVTLLGILFYFPLTIALALFAPLVQGLELPEEIVVNDVIEQRVKVKVEGEGSALVETEVPIKDWTDILNFSISYDPDEITVIPNFKFQGVDSRLSVKNSLVFYQRDLKSQVEMEVFKTFDLKQLLAIGFRGNVFLYDKYPEIYNFVYESEEKNPAFSKTADLATHTAFANEFIKFTKSAFSLTVDNVLEVIQSETPFIKGLVDYKSSFLSLIEYKEFDQIGFMKIGNVLFMKISFIKQRPFDLIIPLIRGEGRIFKISYDKKENITTVSPKFYKFNLDKTNWVPEVDGELKERSEAMTALEVFDFFSSSNFKSIIESGEKAQSLYGYYFETSRTLLQKGDSDEIGIWKNKVGNLMKLLQAIPAEQEPAGEIKNKLLQNLGDLLDALENKNTEYFGISQTTTV